MIIDDRLIKSLEDISMLRLTPQEREVVRQSLAATMGYAEMLSELDTADTEATAHPLPQGTGLRADEVEPSCPRQILLQNAARTRDGFFTAPKTVE